MHWPMCVATCICGKDDWETEHLLPVAIHCFKNQTYPEERRMLVLVTEEENVHKLQQYNGDFVRVLAVEPQPTLGDLRNIPLEFIKDEMPGAFALQWDADDWHPAERMAVQMQACLASPGMASFLKRQITYSFSKDVAFVRYLRLYGAVHPPEGTPTPIHGTICHPDTPLRYPAIKGEDTPFWQLWNDGPGAIEIDNDARLYVRFAHGDSTSGEAHVMQDHVNDPSGTWALTDPEADYLTQVLKFYRRSA